MRFQIVKPLPVHRIVTAAAAAVAGLVLAALGAEPAAAAAPFWEVADVSGAALGCLAGTPSDRIVVVACTDGCVPIPWQLDERDEHGRLALDQGPAPNPDEPSEIVDDNDEIRWMVADAGRPMRREEIPPNAVCGRAFHLRHAGGAFDGWVYAFVLPSAAPRASTAYVRYDPAADVITGTRVSLGLRGTTPQYLGLRDADGSEHNVLDRLKVRASARFLGLIPMGRDEDDLDVQLVAWHAGPIRVVRRQHQRIRLGWGIRSPRFGSDTYFYRDFAELPVSLRLNFPPTYFFRSIEVRVVLDFRDLRGWRLLAPGLREPLVVGRIGRQQTEQLSLLRGSWFALIGPDVQLVQFLGTSPSLTSVHRRLLYREQSAEAAPEAQPGEMPGVGYLLSRWERVGNGAHWFSATSYALPPDYNLPRFLRERSRRLVIDAHPFPERGPPG